ncbi:MAG TPA: NAD-dependent epimerase/dehydratase family protein, partial [Fimbriimonadaceae bacterium]|nr:NAD-dependent epimerase/dehydratase family protein [Fimbriimonadaceae bacterium]
RAPITEISPLQPYDDYTKSKWEAEESLRQFSAGSDLEVVIVRPALVYGPDAPGNFGLLLKNSGKRLPLGAVKNKRSLISVRNLADFLVTCCTHPDAAGESFVIGDGRDWSTAELIEAVADAQDTDAKLLPVPPLLLRAGAAVTGKRKMASRLLDNLQVDISKATHLLGWRPPYAAEDELAMSAKLSSRNP